MAHLMRATAYNGDDKIVAVHKFYMPELCEKYCYRHGTSMLAFQKEQRKLLNDFVHKDKPYPALRYSIRHDDDKLFPMSMQESGVPIHADIYEFYKAIGWSYARRKFCDHVAAEYKRVNA